MGEYSDWKPQDDLGHSSDDEALDFLHSEPAGFGPSVPRGYPHGFRDEPDMGWEDRLRSDRRVADLDRDRWMKPRRGFFSRLFGRNDDMGYEPQPPPPGYGGYQQPQPPAGYQTGLGAPPALGGAQQALRILQTQLNQARRGDAVSLAGLQQAFDNFRNALKTAFPFGGPHGPIG
jgi:hypothetical protein